MTGSKPMAIVGGHSAPDTIGLPSFERILETLQTYGAGVTDLSGDLDSLTAYDRVWNVLREIELWEPFTGYASSSVDGQHQLAVWMSLVEHKVKSRR